MRHCLVYKKHCNNVRRMYVTKQMQAGMHRTWRSYCFVTVIVSKYYACIVKMQTMSTQYSGLFFTGRAHCLISAKKV